MSELKVRNEGAQGNLRKFLAVMEDTYTAKNFFRELAERAEVNCFRVTDIDVNGAKYALVIDNHADKRAYQRTLLGNMSLQRRLITLLSGGILGEVVTRNPLSWDYDAKTLVPEDTQPSNGTVIIVDSINNCGFVLEAGYSYIHLVTVFSTVERRTGRTSVMRNGVEIDPYKRYYTKTGTDVWKVTCGGLLERGADEVVVCK